MANLPGYDNWKTTEPEEFDHRSDDPDCTCFRKRDRFCPVHGIDPDQAREERRERDA